MKKFYVSPNEDLRINTLHDYHVLDTDFDGKFDNLVEIASAHFGVPIALVSLVDIDRQWFKAVVGLDVRQTPREHSFCTHAIKWPDDVMVVEDAWDDARFRASALVKSDPHIRFYAGAPIVADNGAVLGTVCVIDRKPRHFSAADRAVLARFAATARSMLDLHRRNVLLHDAVKRDVLTGLLNRRGLESTLDQAIRSALNGQGCGLLYLDLDHFKQVNDTYGHAIGDALLEEIARRMQTAVRQGDLVARIGGDEFVILLAHPIDLTSLEDIAGRVLSACIADFAQGDIVITPGMTIGGALAPLNAMTATDLLRAADGALYAAKRSGRGTLMTAGNDQADGRKGKARTQAGLLLAIERDELFLEWQSCHNISTGAIDGYEALVRWRHPDHGVLAPDRFVPLAEACGLSPQLDMWVMFQACKEAAACPDDSYFSVNLSADSISSGNVVPLIRAALDQSGLPPHRLVLEITETKAISDESAAIAHIHQLKAMGVLIALDDFGVGYSALACLQTYPFDILKLDRKFVSAIGVDERGRLVADAVIRLANSLNIAVVAEGIETRDQAEIVASVGCWRGQGYLWARPKPAPWMEPGGREARRRAMPPTIDRAAAGPSLRIAPQVAGQTCAQLPSPDTTRWVPRRKAQVVAAVAGGMITLDAACQRYALTVEEFTGWQRTADNLAIKRRRINGMRQDHDGDAPATAGTAAVPLRLAAGRDHQRPERGQGAGNLAPATAEQRARLAFGENHHPVMSIPADDRRGASRFTTLLIVAKLVIDGVEQFCLVKDASTTGLKIKLFAPLPDHRDLVVELANGERFAVQCAWRDGEYAGMEFSAPISLDSLLNYTRDANRRRHIRLRIALGGVLHLGETTTPITFQDISQHGAAFRAEKWLLKGELVKIETATLPLIYAKVRWRNHPHYGVAFEGTFQLHELATHFYAAQGPAHHLTDGCSVAFG